MPIKVPVVNSPIALRPPEVCFGVTPAISKEITEEILTSFTNGPVGNTALSVIATDFGVTPAVREELSQEIAESLVKTSPVMHWGRSFDETKTPTTNSPIALRPPEVCFGVTPAISKEITEEILASFTNGPVGNTALSVIATDFGVTPAVREELSQEIAESLVKTSPVVNLLKPLMEKAPVVNSPIALRPSDVDFGVTPAISKEITEEILASFTSDPAANTAIAIRAADFGVTPAVREELSQDIAESLIRTSPVVNLLKPLMEKATVVNSPIALRPSDVDFGVTSAISKEITEEILASFTNGPVGNTAVAIRAADFGVTPAVREELSQDIAESLIRTSPVVNLLKPLMEKATVVNSPIALRPSDVDFGVTSAISKEITEEILASFVSDPASNTAVAVRAADFGVTPAVREDLSQEIAESLVKTSPVVNLLKPLMEKAPVVNSPIALRPSDVDFGVTPAISKEITEEILASFVSDPASNTAVAVRAADFGVTPAVREELAQDIAESLTGTSPVVNLLKPLMEKVPVVNSPIALRPSDIDFGVTPAISKEITEEILASFVSDPAGNTAVAVRAADFGVTPAVREELSQEIAESLVKTSPILSQLKSFVEKVPVINTPVSKPSVVSEEITQEILASLTKEPVIVKPAEVVFRVTPAVSKELTEEIEESLRNDASSDKFKIFNFSEYFNFKGFASPNASLPNITVNNSANISVDTPLNQPQQGIIDKILQGAKNASAVVGNTFKQAYEYFPEADSTAVKLGVLTLGLGLVAYTLWNRSKIAKIESPQKEIKQIITPKSKLAKQARGKRKVKRVAKKTLSQVERIAIKKKQFLRKLTNTLRKNPHLRNELLSALI